MFDGGSDSSLVFTLGDQFYKASQSLLLGNRTNQRGIVCTTRHKPSSGRSNFLSSSCIAYTWGYSAIYSSLLLGLHSGQVVWNHTDEQKPHLRDPLTL